MAELGEAGEQMVLAEVGVDTVGGVSTKLGSVGLHLRDIIHEVSWLGEQLQLLGIDHITELIFNLDNQLNYV